MWRFGCAFLLLLSALAQASSDAAVTLVLIRVSQESVVKPDETFSSALLFTLPGQEAATLPKPARYPAFGSPLAIPLRVTSAFSMRFHPILRRFTQHEGTDFAAPGATPVLATEQGTVVEATYHPRAGNYITLSHPGGWRSRYLHLNNINVIPGQKVVKGSVIGLSGNTGRSTGPHLHFELAHKGMLIDSTKLLSSESGPEELLAQKTVDIEPSVPKVMMVTVVAGEKKIVVKYKGKTTYAKPNQIVFGSYKVVVEKGRYQLKDVS